MLERERSHFEDFELLGRWWLPDTPERQQYGTLRFRKSGNISLEMMGSLRAPDLQPGAQKDFFSQKYNRVFGATEDGKPCTAEQVRVTSSRLFPFETGKSRAEVHRFYLGAHFPSEQPILFASQTAEFAYLEDWIGIDPYQRQPQSDPFGIVLRIPSETQTVLQVRIESEKTEITVFLRPKFVYSFRGEFSGGRRAWILIRPDEPKSAEWFEGMVRKLGDFLTLCSGRAVSPRRIAGYLKPQQDKAPDPQEKLELFLRLMEGKEDTDSTDLMPMPFVRIAQNAANVLTSWFLLQEKIAPVLGLLLGTYYNSHQYVETEFLTLMQAAEIFHRRMAGGAYLSVKEWQPHREILTKAIPPTLESAHRDSLKKRLEFANEYSLRKRLQELVKGLTPEIRERITKGSPNFAGEFADTRNALVHEGGGGIQAHGPVELWEANQRLRLLLNVLIWKALGLPDMTFSADWFEALR